jgi:hypothetical protein
MSIFESLKNAIFGTHTPSPTSVPTPAGAQASGPSSASKPPPAPPTAPADRNTSSPPFDVEAALNQRAKQTPEKLNWQTSIVDLMKLVELDSSLGNRKALAKELGYTGDMNDSASMNIWLHKEVMRKLADSGGKVPDSLRH